MRLASRSSDPSRGELDRGKTMSALASKIAAPQAKAAQTSAGALASRRPTLAELGRDPAEQAQLTPGATVNRAASRLLKHRNIGPLGNWRRNDEEQDAAEDDTIAVTASRDLSWDFSKIPLFAPDQLNKGHAPSPLDARNVVQPKLETGAVDAPLVREPDRAVDQVGRMPNAGGPRASADSRHNTEQRIAVSGVPLQRKLTVGEAHDPAEAEADRIADRVMRMPDPDVSIARSVSQLSRKCAECADEERAIQTKPPPGQMPAIGDAPAIVHDVLSMPGQPLHPVARQFMERRFGHDFSQVRIHVDAAAARSAQSVNALAYTAGNHIVFGQGKYAPTSESGRSLLAHELTHVLQQNRRAKSFSTIARASDSTTVTVQAPRGPNICTLDQGQHISVAARRADSWLNSSINALNALLTSPGAPAATAASNALSRHFHSATVATATHVRDRLGNIRQDMNTRVNLTVECHNSDDRMCGASGAYVQNQNNTMAFCPSFFDANDDPNWQAETIVHETSHALLGGPLITDRGYRDYRVYRMLSTPEALTNADSYALLVEEIASGRAVLSNPPRDSFTDCPEDWKPLLRVAIARAQQWNRYAQTSTQDRRSDWLASWNDLQMRYLGSTSAAALNAAQTVYDTVVDALSSDIAFECELGPGGRCAAGAQTYWYAIGHFHICRSWRTIEAQGNISAEDRRVTAILTGLYGYSGGVGDNTRRQNLANLARELKNRYWRY